MAAPVWFSRRARVGDAALFCAETWEGGAGWEACWGVFLQGQSQATPPDVGLLGMSASSCVSFHELSFFQSF